MLKKLFLTLLLAGLTIAFAITIVKSLKKSGVADNLKTSQLTNTLKCPPECNVILISIDDLRSDYLNTYGHKNPTSPNIDKFAQKSLVFENSFAQSSWTLPSHTAMLTGKYPHNLDIEIISDRLPESSSIAEILKNNDYLTAAYTSGAFINEDHGFARGFDTFEENDSWQDAETLTQNAIHWLNNNKQKKIFLFLHYFHVHDPYSPNGDSAKLVDPNYTGSLKSFDISQIVKLNKEEITLPQSDLEQIKTLYDAELLELDSNLGKIFQLLSETKLIDNSIVVITSDHGEEFGERGGWGIHGYSLYDELIKVPLIIRIPDSKPERIPHLTELVDIVPTITSILNLKNPLEFDGVNLLDIASGKLSKDYVYSETFIQKQQMLDNIEEGYSIRRIADIPPQVQNGLNQQKKQKIKTRTIRTTGFKLIKNFNGSTEFYNIKDDPLEKNNLAGQGLKEETGLLEKLKDY